MEMKNKKLYILSRDNPTKFFDGKNIPNCCYCMTSLEEILKMSLEYDEDMFIYESTDKLCFEDVADFVYGAFNRDFEVYLIKEKFQLRSYLSKFYPGVEFKGVL